MSISSLASYVDISPNCYNGRSHTIDTITPHYVSGNCKIETIGEIFSNPNRRASSNYGIGSDGRIGCYVDEEDTAWTSGSRANDGRAVTIECANLADTSLTQACWDSLVALCVDICKRYGWSGLYYCGSADYGQCPEPYMLLTMHKWFQDTDCPGPWFSRQFDRLAHEVTAAMSGEVPDVKPRNNTQGGKLDVDGIGGYNTILDMQHALGTYEDGTISGQVHNNYKNFPAFTNVEWGGEGSPMVREMQRRIGAGQDGIWGFETSTKLQMYLLSQGYSVGSYGVDGCVGYDTVVALQNCLNDGRFMK